jgi:hypothetical protein
MKFNTKVIHGGQQGSNNRAVMPPVFQTSTFAKSGQENLLGLWLQSLSKSHQNSARGSLGKYRKWCGLAFHRDLLLLIALMRSFKAGDEIITYGRFVWWDLSDVYSNIQPFRHQVSPLI